MDETGVVRAVSRGRAEVEFRRSPACERCGACAPSGQGVLTAELEAPEGLVPGDRVRVAVEPGAVLGSAAWLCLLPLAALLCGVGWAHLLKAGPAVQLACGLAGVAASGLLLRLLDRRLAARPGWTPRIVEVRR
ncbi:MAG: SoxR reducing system RseC family protein [Elusimicrobiota bacterium]|jgi:positive regulator of sigma E activity